MGSTLRAHRWEMGMKDTHQEYLSSTWTRVHLGPGMKKAPVLSMNVEERVTWDWLQTK